MSVNASESAPPNRVGADRISEIFGVTKDTVLGWARRGWVPSTRDIRGRVCFDHDEVRQALAARGRTEVARA